MRSTGGHQRSAKQTGTALAARLRERMPELEAGLAALVDEVSRPREVGDPTYLQSLQSLRTALLEYAISVIEVGEGRIPDAPTPLLGATRLAARSGVALDTLLRRYSTGNAMFGDVLVEEATRAEVSPTELRSLLSMQATGFNRLLEVVSEEHRRACLDRPTNGGEWRREYLEELLAGRQPIEAVELGYDFHANHLALVSSDAAAPGLMRELARRLDRRFIDYREEGPLWTGWLGGRRPIEFDRIHAVLGEISPAGTLVALGEPGEGISGFRLSHRQAKAALPIGERARLSVVRYADVALLASIARDDLAVVSFRQLYLEPLDRERDGGKATKAMLRAYFAADRNVSSAAAALGVNRNTLTGRLRSYEAVIGRSLSDCAAELEAALQLEQLEHPGSPPT